MLHHVDGPPESPGSCVCLWPSLGTRPMEREALNIPIPVDSLYPMQRDQAAGGDEGRVPRQDLYLLQLASSTLLCCCDELHCFLPLAAFQCELMLQRLLVLQCLSFRSRGSSSMHVRAHTGSRRPPPLKKRRGRELKVTFSSRWQTS